MNKIEEKYLTKKSKFYPMQIMRPQKYWRKSQTVKLTNKIQRKNQQIFRKSLFYCNVL